MAMLLLKAAHKEWRSVIWIPLAQQLSTNVIQAVFLLACSHTDIHKVTDATHNPQPPADMHNNLSCHSETTHRCIYYMVTSVLQDQQYMFLVRCLLVVKKMLLIRPAKNQYRTC